MPVFSILGDADPMVQVKLTQNELICCESGAMVMMESNLDLDGTMGGGIMQAAVRKLANGESFFQQRIRATRGDGMCLLAPKLPGAVKMVDVGSVQYRVSDGAYLAASQHVTLTSRMQGIGKALFANTGGFFVIETSGTGQMAVAGFGVIVSMDVSAGKEITVDNGHVVAWDSRMQYEVSLSTARNQGAVGKLVNSVISGEMAVLKFRGPGKLLLCSRNRNTFGR